MAASKSTLRCFILNKRKLEWLLQSTNHRAKFSLSPCETKRIFLFLSLFLSFPSRRDNARRTESGGRGRRKYPRVTRTNGTGLSGNIKFTISGAFQYRGFACSCLTRQSHDYPHGTWGVKGEILSLSLSLTREPSSFLPCNALFCIGNGP